MNIKRLLSCFSVLFVLTAWVPHSVAGATGSEGGKRRQARVHRITQAVSRIRIDGVLDEAAWERAFRLGLLYEVQPGENTAPPVRTEMLLTYGPSHVYVAFVASDPNPASIRARVTDRDHIDDDDRVGIVLDTFNDERRTYNFFCNPLGVQSEFIRSPEGGNPGWDAIWSSAGRMNSNGYVVEMAIPFSTLRFQHKKGEQVWGIDAVRHYPRGVDHVIGLFPRDRGNNCYMCQADKVMGFADAKPGNNVELDPTIYAIFSRDHTQIGQDGSAATQKEISPGLTGRWTFTPNMTLSATVNPDFSHVEADALQLDINSPFALYYPEKRPFFLEGGSQFNTNYDIIHTRTLAAPDWGIKLTGKEGKNNLGFFSVRDRMLNLVFPGSQYSNMKTLDMSTQGSALRYRRDVGTSSYIGAVVTSREGGDGDYFNRLVGVDADLRLSSRHRLVLDFYSSRTHYPTDRDPDLVTDLGQPTDPFGGRALGIRYTYHTRHVTGYVNYQDISPGFRADLGYAPQADYRNIETRLGYKCFKGPGHWFNRMNFLVGYELEKNHGHGLLYEKINGWFHYGGPMQSSLWLHGEWGQSVFGGQTFDRRLLHYDFTMRPNAHVSLGLSGVFGQTIDYMNIRQGRLFRISPSLAYHMGRHLALTAGHLAERLDVPQGRLYNANITYLKLVYQFTRRMFFRGILQYVDYDFNQPLYTQTTPPHRHDLATQVLFSYKLNPQTVLFLGYSDQYEDQYGTDSTLLHRLSLNSYTVFLKIGYALVL